MSLPEAQAVEQALWQSHISADKQVLLQKVLQRLALSMQAQKTFEYELAVFQNKLPSLMKTYEGKFVLVQHDHLSIHNSYEEALEEGYLLFGLEKPFMVQRIEDRVYYL